MILKFGSYTSPFKGPDGISKEWLHNKPQRDRDTLNVLQKAEAI